MVNVTAVASIRIAVLRAGTTGTTGSLLTRPLLTLNALPVVKTSLICNAQPMSGKLNVPKVSYETTLRRLAKIQSHLSSRPRSQRLKDKVCIVTGSGSLTGIGYVLRPFVISKSGFSLTR